MQTDCFELPNTNFCLIDYREVLIRCERDIINDLHSYQLLEPLNLSKSDTKKIMYHHVIHSICEAVMNTNTKNKVLVYNNLNNISLELFKYSTRGQTLDFLNILTNKIKRLLPIKIYDHEDDYDMFVDQCNENRGELRSRASMIEQFLRKHQDRRFDFENARKFAKKFELTYLSHQYFNDIKIKNLVFI